MNDLENRKKIILDILIFLEESHIWDEAKYYAIIIYNSSKIDIYLLDNLDELISNIINNTKDIKIKKRLIESKDKIKKMKELEINDIKNDQLLADNLINNI